MREQLELSSSGFRFPYHRFLADIAAGIFAILLLVLIYYLPDELPEALSTAILSLRTTIGQEMKVLIIVLFGIAAVPIGLILNGVGWFILGWTQQWGVQFWYRCHRWSPVGSTSRIFRRDLLVEVFDLDANCLYSRAQLFKSLLNTRWPLYLDDYRHVMGLKTLVRSLVFLAILGTLLFSKSLGAVWTVGWLVGLFFACILVGGLLEYYLSLAVLARTLMLILDDWYDALPEGERPVVKKLLPQLVASISLLLPGYKEQPNASRERSEDTPLQPESGP